MSEFKTRKDELREAKVLHEGTRRKVFLAQEELKRLGREKEKLGRGFGADSEEIQSISRKERMLNDSIVQDQVQADEELQVHLDRLVAFEAFTDPREHISQFSRDFPLLLFPVRIETRFKTIALRGGGNQGQLWVRIFPDDCVIDTFEDVLSESEIIRVRNYWATVWSGGKSDDEDLKTTIQDFRKAAWNGIAGNFQAGRAFWLTQNYEPTNIGDLPERDTADQVILAITAEELPDGTEQGHLRTYWVAAWLAAGDTTAMTEAYDNLVTTLGNEDRAKELLAAYQPFNFKDVQAPAENPPLVKVSFVQFPKLSETESQLSAWSQAARATTLPERFVLIGYKGKDSEGRPIRVLNKVGTSIPNPLIVGPNPSIDTHAVLKGALIDEYEALPVGVERKRFVDSLYDQLKEEVKAVKDRVAFLAEFQALSEGEQLTALETIFEDFKDDVKATRYIEYLCQRSETKWLFDFEEALKMGMAFKVDLEPAVYRGGFDRLMVVGVKLSSDEGEAQKDLETLIEHHHYGSSGFSILSQGTPTNNTEEEGSGYSEREDAETTFARYFPEEEEDDPEDFWRKRDGRWLAELLGIDSENATLKQVANYYQKDQCEAKAMNTALWSGTIGYFMESMMTPVFEASDERRVRDFYRKFVSGRGSIPAIRIGDQPYGILATSTVKHLKWLTPQTDISTITVAPSVSPLAKMYKVFLTICKHWKGLLDQVAYVGKEEGDVHDILLQAIGLHATSVTFEQRFAKSFAHLYNHLSMTQVRRDKLTDKKEKEYKKAGLELLAQFGHFPNEKDEEPIPILEKFFLTTKNKIDGPLIDDQPLSEANPIRAYTNFEAPATEGENYIQWLIAHAEDDPDKIKKQEGFAEGPPRALLYQMLRHSLQLEFSNTALQLFHEASILNTHQVKQAKVDAPFIGIRAESRGMESKYELLDQKDDRITAEDITVAQHISKLIASELTVAPATDLKAVVRALKHFKNTPTARLERVFAEHLDCCTYRLDAWLLGFVNMHLHRMRYPKEELPPTPGIYLGAFGWVENLKPDPEALTEVNLEGELEEIFNPKGELTIHEDSLNGGYIHAPSINQAISASVLRNAYISEASDDDPEVYKVNLSSERVRLALGIIQGMRQGQSLGALLGYQLERGLHDRYAEEEVDIFIYELRVAFPLKGNHMTETAEEDLESITQIEARNVVNGLALVDHVNATGNKNYPYGKDIGYADDPAFENHRKIVDEEVERLRNINDAVADLATAEGIHQAVQGNYDRAAGNLEAYAKGGTLPMPDVIRTPRSGISLTNRVGIHLDALASATSTDPARVKAEPGINQFLQSVLPPMADICCQVEYKVPTYEEEDIPSVSHLTISMEDLGLHPIDLIYLINTESAKSLSALDEYILKWVHVDLPLNDATAVVPRPDIQLEIKYTEPIPGKISIFEITPLLKSLRHLLLASRPLKNSDMLMSNEAKSDSEVHGQVDLDRINHIQRGAFTHFKSNFIDPNDVSQGIDIAQSPGFVDLFDEEDFEVVIGNQNAIITDIDAYISLFETRMRSLSQFGGLQNGFGYVYDRKAEIYANIYQKVLKYRDRWHSKEEKYDDLIVEFNLATEEARKIKILQKAERTISSTYILPTPPSANYRIQLDNKKLDFDNKRLEIETWLADKFITLKSLVDSLETLRNGGLAPLLTFDLLELDTADEERQILVLAEDMVNQAIKLNENLKNKAEKAQEHLDLNASDADPKKQITLLTQLIHELFGEDFAIVPSFSLSTEHGAELKNSFDARDQLLNYQVTEEGTDFPVDDWLYSIARVRDKMNHWEHVVLMAEGFKDQELDLHPLQLPYRENDSWLGLSYPKEYKIDSDRLLYTAYINSFDPNVAQCGLLIDEWTEVIPGKEETTGLSFQYDQPNAEPPQSMLLLTPSELRGSWTWDEVVDSLHETLDMARLRAIEPALTDKTAYAQFLPATVSAVTRYPLITIALNYAMNIGMVEPTNDTDND